MGIIRDFLLCSNAFFMLRKRDINAETWATPNSVYIYVNSESSEGEEK